MAQTARTVVDVAAWNHILLLLSDGTVVGGGFNRSGELAQEPSGSSLVPLTRIKLPAKAVQVAVSGETSFALLEDGTVWAWGQGYSGELGVKLSGRNVRPTPAAIPGLHGVKKLVASETTGLALLADGTVRAWGLVSRLSTKSPTAEAPDPVTVTGLKDVAEIAGTSGYGIAATREGRAIAWDLLDHPYLLPDGKQIAPAPPTVVAELSNVVSVAVQNHTTAAVTADGSVWTWGQNSQGGLGNGTTASGPGSPPQFEPGRVAGVGGAIAVKGGGASYLVLRKDGTLIGWGSSDFGQLGAGVSGRRQPKPTPIKLPNVEAFWLGGNYSFARTKGGAFWFWGHRDGAAVLLGERRGRSVPARVPLDSLLAALQ